MTNTPTIITIIAALLIGFCLGGIYQIRTAELCRLGVSSKACIDMCFESKINDKGILLKACRIICKDNNDCKASCLSGTLIEAEI